MDVTASVLLHADVYWRWLPRGRGSRSRKVKSFFEERQHPCLLSQNLCFLKCSFEWRAVRAQALCCSTFLLLFFFFHSQSVYRSAASPPTRSCILLILPSDIPVTGITFVGKVSETDSLFAGRIISTAWGQAQQWASGICVICCEDSNLLNLL